MVRMSEIVFAVEMDAKPHQLSVVYELAKVSRGAHGRRIPKNPQRGHEIDGVALACERNGNQDGFQTVHAKGVWFVSKVSCVGVKVPHMYKILEKRVKSEFQTRKKERSCCTYSALLCDYFHRDQTK